MCDLTQKTCLLHASLLPEKSGLKECRNEVTGKKLTYNSTCSYRTHPHSCWPRLGILCHEGP